MDQLQCTLFHWCRLGAARPMLNQPRTLPFLDVQKRLHVRSTCQAASGRTPHVSGSTGARKVHAQHAAIQLSPSKVVVVQELKIYAALDLSSVSSRKPHVQHAVIQLSRRPPRIWVRPPRQPPCCSERAAARLALGGHACTTGDRSWHMQSFGRVAPAD